MSVAAAGQAAARASAGRAAAARRLDPVLVTLALVIVYALVWRLAQINQSLIGDEGFTFLDIKGQSFGSLVTVVHTGGEDSPPLYFMLAWFTAKLGDPSVWIRLPSIVLGTATIPVVYLTAREVFGRAAGLVSASVLALSPFAIYYSVEARPYATMAFCVALSTLAVLRAVATGSRWWWITYALAAAGAAYSHYTSVFLLATQGAWAFWVCRRRLLEPLLAQALALLIYLPWLPHIRGKTLFFGVLYPLSGRRVATDALRTVVGFPNGSLRGIPTNLGLAIIAVCAAIGLVALWRRQQPWRDSRVVLLVLLALATPVGLLIYSLTRIDIWLPRGLFASAPAQAVLLGAVLAAPPLRTRVVVVGAVLLTLFLGTIRALSSGYTRPPLRQLAGYIDHVAGPRDPVVDISIVGPLDIPTMMHRPHPQFRSVSQALASFPAASAVYVIQDETVARLGHLGLPAVPGFRLTATRHYGGSFPSDVYSYRRGA